MTKRFDEEKSFFHYPILLLSIIANYCIKYESSNIPIYQNIFPVQLHKLSRYIYSHSKMLPSFLSSSDKDMVYLQILGFKLDYEEFKYYLDNCTLMINQQQRGNVISLGNQVSNQYEQHSLSLITTFL